MRSIKLLFTRTSSSIAIVATLLSQVTFSLPASAGDNKVYPGSGCLPASATYASNLIRVNGKVQANNSSIVVKCPIVRDTTTGGVPNSFIDVKGNVDIDSCSLNTYKVDGTLIAKHKDSDGSFENIGNGVKRIDIRNADQSNQGAYEIDCVLSAGAEIVRYSLAE